MRILALMFSFAGRKGIIFQISKRDEGCHLLSKLGLYPPKAYSNMVHLKMAPWKRRFLLKTIIFRFHVKLGEGNKFVASFANDLPL